MRKLITDNGGATRVAAITGKNRTTPYRWIAQGFVNTKVLEVLKEHNPTMNMNDYF